MAYAVTCTMLGCFTQKILQFWKIWGSPFRGLGFLFLALPSYSQTFPISGKVVDERYTPLKAIEVHIKNQTDSITSVTGKDGNFTSKPFPAGTYYISITAHGYDDFHDTINNTSSPSGFPQGRSEARGGVSLFILSPTLHMLDEVKIVQKVLAMAQKDDTLEFNAGAFKVNPDADAADLVRKMPTIDLNGKTITAQGENVTKIVVDGKPFFGNDPYAALKNLPADVIDKVQVYNEKSDQEQFTGFSEGNTTKTINIITKANKKQGIFGKIYGGAGEDEGNNDMYGAGLSVNQFSGDKRITLTGQSNNINIQNFSDNSSSAGGGAGGLSTTNAAGINYSDKWGKKVDVSGSYFFNDVNNTTIRDTRKTYVTTVDSQIYNENNPSSNQNSSHRFNMRLNYNIDSTNSILLTPQLSYNKNVGNSSRDGNTVQAGDTINKTINANTTNTTGLNFSNNLLYRHKFHKKGRTFSMGINTGNNGNNGNTFHTAQDIYNTSPSLNDNINQKTLQNQNTWNLSGNATYTEPVTKTGLLKLEYDISYIPAVSQRNTYDLPSSTNPNYLFDTAYSNDFTSNNIAHKAGASYQVHTKKAEFSFGLNYQLTELRSAQTQPIYFQLNQDFQNLLPVASFHYKFSKTKNLQCNYNTSTQAPSVSQLQNVVNNTDPLHLYIGNPSLKQPYRHNLTIRYNATTQNAKNSFSASLTGAITQHNIASNSIIADSAITVGPNHIPLAQGSQLTMPVNIDGFRSLNANISYGLPLDFIKCRVNLSVNGTATRAPALINNQVNIQDNTSGGINISLNSNISENVDFTISSALNVVSNTNSINTQLNTTYLNGNTHASLNLIFWKGIVFNSGISYQTNSGLSAGYDQNYALWNMSLGKKIFKSHKRDIRLSAVDILNQNNNIQHTITDTYIQDTRSNIIQRYVLLVFTYKLNEFKK